MSGYLIVCNKRTNDSKCTMAISADSKEEVVEKALEHMTSVHGMKRTRGLEDELKARIKKVKRVA